MYDHKHAQIYEERWHGRALNATHSPAEYIDEHPFPAIPRSQDFQLYHSRKTGEFRMFEHFLPQVNPQASFFYIPPLS